MKKTKWLFILAIAISSATISVSCKNKKAESTTQEDKTKDNVEISTDATLRSSVNDVVKAYNGVEAEVKDGVVTLRGNIRQDEMQTLIMKVQELKPKKVENQLVIKS